MNKAWWFLIILVIFVAGWSIDSAIFGENLFDLVIMTVLLAFIIVLILAIPFFTCLAIRKGKVNRWLWTKIALGVVALFLVFHLPMSFHLRGLKTEFRKISKDGGTMVFSGESSSDLDFGGDIDKIIEARDKILIKWHYLPGIRLNGWWETSDTGTQIVMLYVFIPLPKAFIQKYFGWNIPDR